MTGRALRSFGEALYARRTVWEIQRDQRRRAGHALVVDVHRHDEMHAFIAQRHPGDPLAATAEYLDSGRVMVDGLDEALTRVGRTLERDRPFLEFACGHGRFTRHLVGRVDPRRITVSDIHEGGVAFVTTTFGVDGFPSVADPAELLHDGRYRTIFVASLFSHLNHDHRLPWVEALVGLLEPDGVLIFSTHGIDALHAVPGRVGLEEVAEGFWYGPGNETQGRLDGAYYGTAYVDEGFVRRAIEGGGVGRVLAHLPRGLWAIQDVYVVGEVSGTEVVPSSFPPMRGRWVAKLVPRPAVRGVRRFLQREMALVPPREVPPSVTADGVLGQPFVVAKSVVSDPGADDLAFPPFAPAPKGGDELAVPPEERWTVAAEFLEGGHRDATRLVEIVAEAGCELAEGTRVLDFGCGPGRMLRWLPSELDLWGVDVDADRIAWCQKELSPPFRFVTGTTFPHLNFEDRTFDLVYAGSVFTHLAELADAWLLELLRVTRPGGLLYLTVHDQRSVQWCQEMSPSAPLRALTGADFPAEREAQFRTWSAQLGDGLDGFTIHRGYHSQVFYDRAALERHWSRYAEVVAVVPEAFSFHQTAFVLRRRADDAPWR